MLNPGTILRFHYHRYTLADWKTVAFSPGHMKEIFPIMLRIVHQVRILSVLILRA